MVDPLEFMDTRKLRCSEDVAPAHAPPLALGHPPPPLLEGSLHRGVGDARVAHHHLHRQQGVQPCGLLGGGRPGERDGGVGAREGGGKDVGIWPPLFIFRNLQGGRGRILAHEFVSGFRIQGLRLRLEGKRLRLG